MRRSRKKLAAHREEPGTTEQTLASLVSSASARTVLELQADTPGINGMYIPRQDRIVLFRCRGKVPAVAVALEEAGHSLQRHDYLRLETRMEAISTKLTRWHPIAKHLIDWLEDGRVYGLLKADYPGVADELDNVFDVRRAALESVSWRVNNNGPWETADFARIQDVGQEYLKIVEMYEQGRVPATFDGVLDYCEKLVADKPHTYPAPKDGTILTLVECKPGDQQQDAATLPIDAAHTVTVDSSWGAWGARYTNRRSIYPWPVIDERTVATT